MKQGQKRAVRVYTSESEAIAHAAQYPNLYAVHRPGESIRCKAYCACSRFCDQYKAIEDEANSWLNEDVLFASGKQTATV